MTSREKFEAWAKKEKLGIAYGDCGYVFSSTEMAWRAWQSQNAELAVQLANAESKCGELAEELSAVDKIHNEAEFITDDHYEQCPPEVQKTIRSLAVLQIPAYDAFLAEVRAQGVETVIAYHRERADALHHVDRNNAIRHSMAALDASDVAAQLRQEAAQ